MDADKKTQLSNAEFELVCDGSKLYFDSTYKVLTGAQVESIIGMPVTDDGAAAAMAEEGITSSFTIGEVSLNGLSPGITYTLKEIQSPAGYIISTNDITFSLSKDSDGIKATVTGDNASVDEDGITIIITNEPGAELPSSGGPGTTWIYLIGSILLLGCGTILVARRRTRRAS